MAGSGGAWKVAYADFVTAMMAFFMVMWLTGQNEDTKKAIGGYFQDPWGTSSESSSSSFQSPTGLGGDASMAEMPSGILPNRSPQSNRPDATELEAGAASVWQQPQKVHLLDSDRDLPALAVSFEEALAELPQLAKDRLTALLPALVGKRNKIEIRAHSTRRPLPPESPFRDHWQLCYERSQAVMQFLEEHGIERERFRLSQSGVYEPLTTRFEVALQNENNYVEVFLLNTIANDSRGTERPAKKPQKAIKANKVTKPKANQQAAH